MTRTAALLLLLALCGCLKPSDGPQPAADATIAGIGSRFAAEYRQTCLDAAAKLRAGEWKTDREYLDGHRGLVADAVMKAGRPWAQRQQAEAMPFGPLKMADWLEAEARR